MHSSPTSALSKSCVNVNLVNLFFQITQIDAALAHGGILALHEYNAPFLNETYTGSTQSGEGKSFC